MGKFEFGKSYKEVLKSLNSSSKPIAIWGCGNVGQEVLSILLENDVAPECFMDSSTELQNTLIFNKYPIVSPDTVINSKSHYIIVSSITHLNEMESQLKKSGFKESTDYLIFNPIQ